jgi:hypothetical protein
MNIGLASYYKLLNDLEIQIDCLIIYEFWECKTKEDVAQDGSWNID